MMRSTPRHIATFLCLGGLAVAASLWGVASAEPTSPTADVQRRGAAIYKQLCANCHGDRGQGVRDKHDDPLHGEQSLEALARRIERTMPEDDEGACVGDDARAVATYIYHAFYSPQARGIELAAARPEPQRLTVEQYRRSVADLVGSFREPRPIGVERGVAAEIFKSRKMSDEERLVGEVAATIDFRFGPEHALFGQVDPKGFSARWRGSILAAETGEYEIIVRSDQAVRLWLNNAAAEGGGDRNEFTESLAPLIDGWVRSGDKTEHRARVFLLGGRAYPLVLDFSCHNQGVNDDKQHREKGEFRAYASLAWKPPHGVEEVVPRRHLSPVRAAETFVVAAAFPPDDRSYGFERGVTISRAWVDAVTAGATATADHVVAHLDELAQTRGDDPQRAEKARAFCARFVERAMRRPIDDATRARTVDAVFADAPDTDTAVRRVVLLTLSSSEFLYPTLAWSEPDAYDVSARLALALWDSLPDRALLDAAARGELSDPAKVREHARRMIADERAAVKLRGFFHHWLELDRADNASKDAEAFPEFDPRLLADLRTSLEMFIDDVVWSEKSDYRQLLLADYLYLNDRLRKVYGYTGDAAGAEEFVRVATPAGQRSGVITHPFLLTAFAYHNNTSPIHRGVFLTRNIVGRRLKPPPEAIEFTDAKFDPSLTMREKVAQLTRDSACMACHATINPLGFSLEHYDAIGRWRTLEKDRPIDAASDFVGDSGETVRLRGARDVAEFAVASDAARRSFVRQLFHHTIKQDPAAFGPDVLDTLGEGFDASGCHVRDLLAQIAVTASMYRPPAAGSTPQGSQP